MVLRRDQRVIVVGAGVGGLVTAVQLAARGLQVRVLERAETPGGKMREVAVGPHRLDAGPTVFTMRWIFEEIFEAAGAQLEAHLSLEPLSIIARHAWSEQERLDLHADYERSLEAIGDFAGAEAARGYRAFCKQARALYTTLDPTFIRASRPSLLGLLGRCGLKGLITLSGVQPYASLWDSLGAYFKDARLRQLFGRYSTYCGSSPFMAPAILMLIAHVEQEGVWSVVGGMHRVALVLAQLAEGLGATIEYGREVTQILTGPNGVRGVQLAEGDRIEAEAIVVNADPAALTSGRFGAEAQRALPPLDPERRSLSALTWCLSAETQGFPLARHNVFFGRDYASEFEDIFGRGRLPRDGTVYVCAQDRGTDGNGTPDGPERLFLLLNAPPRGDRHDFDAVEIEQCEQRVFSRLEHCGLRVRRDPERMVLTTPVEFERRFPATGGALYGQATHGWRASFSRPASRTRIPGLYLAGGGTHPGAGIPMAAISGRLAAEALLADQRST
ncbi:1-hydroxycarotenoid 3,4-desaturase CrtD [Thermochromatium tepidum]|uniref:Phytoene desaturase n=1 Tax=Thermochromatium tepidum ATCC 43061 TaxID=316276 RepID=A0A6I6DWG3_THETI|nr:1-hydroxycarotenoid 3,4-desaturase CrtD [Thermochromatium tepidum]QGU31814.1 phytoene desaturase [Thermochromatium tepidum ATCC 43061]